MQLQVGDAAKITVSSSPPIRHSSRTASGCTPWAGPSSSMVRGMSAGIGQAKRTAEDAYHRHEGKAFHAGAPCGLAPGIGVARGGQGERSFGCIRVKGGISCCPLERPGHGRACQARPINRRDFVYNIEAARSKDVAASRHRRGRDEIHSHLYWRALRPGCPGGGVLRLPRPRSTTGTYPRITPRI